MPAATAEILEREIEGFPRRRRAVPRGGDCADSTSTPVGFEVSFGRPLDDDDEPLARAEPVEIDLGDGTHVPHRRPHRSHRQGRRRHRSRCSTTRPAASGATTGRASFNGGRRLQHALYGLAAVELLKARYKKPKVTAGVYYFSSHKGRQERVRIAAPAQASIAAVLGDLRDVIVKRTVRPHAATRTTASSAITSPRAASAGERAGGDASWRMRRLQAFGRLADHV